MTPRQKRIIATMAIADIVVILVLVVLVTHPAGTQSSPLLSPNAPAGLQPACQWRAAQLLASAGLGGTVTLTPDGPLRFEIAYPFAPSQTAPQNVNEAAQSVWTAFDVALTLLEQEEGCAIFTLVEVAILTHNNRTNVQINASVSTTDLLAFSAGELSEDQFIERVTYTSSITHNE